MTGILNLLAGAVSSVVKDTYFNLVSLLLPGNGTNGAQNNTFLDSSTNNFTITRNGNTTQGTFSPFSQTGWSNFFDGTGDYLTWSGSSIGTNTFVAECWFYLTSTAFSAQYGLFGASTTSGFGLRLINTTTAAIDYLGVAATNFTLPETLVVGSWYHIAAVRNSSNQATIFLNGVRSTSGAISVTTNLSGSTSAIGLSDVGSVYGPMFGYISNARLVIGGTPIYDPTQSTITVPTAPLTAISNTAILTCQDNRFKDNSTNNFTLTRFGDASAQAFSPFAPTAAYSAATVGGSGYFDGTGDYLNVASNTALTFGTGDFTVEGWFYANALGGQPTILNNGSDAAGLVITMLSSKIYAYFVGAGNVFGSSGATIVTNTWYHFAWVRSGSTNTFYLNGAVYGATYSSAGNHASTGGVGIGYSVAGTAFAAWNGYIANVRMVKGTAVYTTAFTPPTAPLTAITNTQLLCNFTNAGITDATAKNDLETVGNAQISTTQSKFGGSSMYFDGTGDYLVVGNMSTNPNLALLAGDFTIEYWYYPLNTSIHATLNNLDDGAGNGSLWILMNGTFSGGSKVQFGYNTGGANGNILFGTGTFTANAWYHVAICRSGSNLRCFINGTQEGSTSTALGTGSIVAYNRNLVIGATLSGGSYTAYNLNGYLDDFRVTKFARYTSNFTAPTAAFPLQ